MISVGLQLLFEGNLSVIQVAQRCMDFISLAMFGRFCIEPPLFHPFIAKLVDLGMAKPKSQALRVVFKIRDL